jgi:hypothetical protein
VDAAVLAENLPRYRLVEGDVPAHPRHAHA